MTGGRKILAFPYDPNPYQEQLYRPMRDRGVTVSYLRGLTPSSLLNWLMLPVMIIGYRYKGYTVFHLHWVFGFAPKLPVRGRWVGRVQRWYFAMCLGLIRVLGYRLVWTAHNVLPHTPLFDDDIASRRLLIRKADVVIVHSKAVLPKLRGFGLDDAKTVIIPHGNYNGAYPMDMTCGQARKHLSLGASDFVLLFWGRIERYKNVPAFLRAAASIARDVPRLRVVVAGACSDQTLKNEVMQAARLLGKNVQLRIGYVDDEDVQLYYRAADLVALPFAEITTSGSALLPLTFGVPTVIPRKGALQDIPAEAVFFYDPAKKQAFDEALSQAVHSKELVRKRKAALQYAASLDWDGIAGRTLRAMGLDA
ncbi:MAG TPA: glycosyltransferase family 4 protein [Candidatus Saccharimonadales bacterium]